MAQAGLENKKEQGQTSLKFPFHVFNKSVVSHGFKKNIVALLSDGKEFLLVLMLFYLLQQSIFGLTKLY